METHVDMVLLAIGANYEELGILINYALCKLLIALDSAFRPPIRQATSLVKLTSCDKHVMLKKGQQNASTRALRVTWTATAYQYCRRHV